MRLKDHKTAEKLESSRFQAVREMPPLHSGLTGRGPQARGVVESEAQPNCTAFNRWLEECTRRHQHGSSQPQVCLLRHTGANCSRRSRSCNDPEGFTLARAFFINQFREAFDVQGTPIRLVFRGKKDRFEEEQSVKVQHGCLSYPLSSVRRLRTGSLES